MGRSGPGGRDLPPRDDREAPPRGVGEVLRGILDAAPMRRGLTLGRLVRSWEEVVGAPLARETTPVGLDGGTLVVEASDGGWAAQVGFLEAELRRRANDVLGDEEVRSVRVVVGRRGPGTRRSRLI